MAMGLLGVLAAALPVDPTAAASPPAPSSPGTEAGRPADRPPARLSYAFGEVSFWRPGADDWTPAEVNTPLSPGDALYTAGDGNLEVQIGARAFVRAAPETEIGLTNRERDYDQLEIKAGRAALDVRGLEPGHTIELDTPHAAFTIEATGYYRLDVGDGTTRFVTRRGGRARLSSAAGATSALGPGEQVVVASGGDAQVATFAAPDLDAWDQWNYDRTDSLIESASARYVSPGVYGLDELDRYGTWRVERDYGPVWVPAGVAADWAPYSDGRWIWDPFYGWTWVDAAPWGWAPSHYGRWVRVRGYWGWAPGPVVVAPAYAPAVVAFFGGDDFSIGVGIGASAVGWVALGWGEPIVPWWGGVGFVGVPWWGGWGGPWVVNSIVIHDHHGHHHGRHHGHHHGKVHARDVHGYCHAHERHALRYDREDRFGRGRHHRGGWRDVRPNHLKPVHGRLRARPVAASLTPGEGRGSRPPEGVRRRQVVATRAAHDNSERLRAAGLRVPDGERSRQRLIRSRAGGRTAAEARPVTGRQRPSPPHAREARGMNRPRRDEVVSERPRQGGARQPSSPRVPRRSVEAPASGSRQAAHARPPVPRGERPAQRMRSREAAPRVERPQRRERASAPAERPRVAPADRARPQRPNPPAARAEQPRRRERAHAPAPRIQQPRDSARVRSREAPAAAPRQMRERGNRAAPPRAVARNSSSLSQSGPRRAGGESRSFQRGASSGAAARGSARGSSRAHR
jgi:hypothetical protein